VTTLPPRDQNDKSPSEITFIYALIDPVMEKMRYIGKANDPHRRLREHQSEKATHHRGRWIESLKSRGLAPEMIILEETTCEQWKEREIYWIAYYRAQGAPLVNGTDGGEGSAGWKATPEISRRMSEAHKGIERSPEWRQRLSESLRGSKFTKERCQNIGNSKRGKKVTSQKTLQRLRESHLGKKKTLEDVMKTAGENDGMSKLTNEKVIAMRQRRAEGMLIRELSEMFHVSIATVGKVVTRMTWKHVI
jgi:hypothetical protein